MVNRLPSWVFLSIAMFSMGFALFPVIRAVIGIDKQIEIQFLTVVSLLIGGLMCGLTAMLLMIKRQPFTLDYSAPEQHSSESENATAAKLHSTGLLIFTGIPLANFLACFYLWINYRHRSAYLDYQGREAICFQVTIYLYLLVSLFMTYVIVGAFAIPLLLIFHLITTIYAVVCALKGVAFRYPTNITIIPRTPTESA